MSGRHIKNAFPSLRWPVKEHVQLTGHDLHLSPTFRYEDDFPRPADLFLYTIERTRREVISSCIVMPLSTFRCQTERNWWNCRKQPRPLPPPRPPSPLRPPSFLRRPLLQVCLVWSFIYDLFSQPSHFSKNNCDNECKELHLSSLYY